MYLTKSSTPIIGWFAVILGFIMNCIFNVQSAIHLDNIGLCIILFTIVIYLLMTPLTIQQQKFSKLQAKMNPELQAIQKKYKGKTNDQAIAAKMNEETQAVYTKYGVNPMGSCVQLIIQIPVLFSLYRVIWNIPAYVTKVKNVFVPLADQLLVTSGAEEFLSNTAKSVAVSFKEMTQLTIIDVLYKFKTPNWTSLAETFPDLGTTITETKTKIDHMNYFLGLNIADSPMGIITSAWKSKAFLLIIGAVMVPVLAALTQWINTKLMVSVQQSEKKDSTDNMTQTMNTMNNVMPLMSAFFCLTLPVGMGIYWIAGAVVRSIQQVIINKQLDKIDVDEVVKKNLDKLNKKREKQGLPPEKMTNNASVRTKNIDVAVAKDYNKESSKKNLNNKAASISDDASAGTNAKKPKDGSLASKAMMVKEYNETHKK